MDLNSLKASLKGVVERAGEAILQIYEDPSQFAVEHKADNSPLTAADKASNDIICDFLRQMPMPFPIISEENKMLPYEERKDFKYFWCVDPLDGTKEFIKRNGEFTINIALVRERESVMGAIYIPVTGEFFFAVQGAGAWYEVDGSMKKLACRSFSASDPGLQVLCSRSHLNAATQKFLERFQDPELMPRGSSLKFLEIAKGQGDVYPRLGPTMEWDTAAAQIILEEAGGKLLNFETGQKLTYNKESLLNPNFIAMGAGQVALD